jgi:outer membrane immunogenic protein
MRKLIQLTTLAAAISALPLAAHAADIAAPLKAPPAAIIASSWTGFYVGASIGAAQDLTSSSDNWRWATTYPAGTLVGFGGGPLAALPAAATYYNSYSANHRASDIGITGGFQGGYNWQTGSLVLGIEGDWSWMDLQSKSSFFSQPVTGIFPPLPNFFFVPGTVQGWTSTQTLDWLTTVRGRIGWATPHILWYVTGGAAWAKVNTSYALVSSPGNSGLLVAAGANGPGTFGQWGLPGGFAGGAFSVTKSGWTVGGGAEAALSEWFGWQTGNKWTAKVEYLYADLGHVTDSIVAPLVAVCATTCTTPAAGNTAFTSTRHITEQLLRVGLNYHF